MLDCELIIFDCDGVLVNTEPITNRVLAQCVSESGWEVDTEFSYANFKGRNLSDILEDVETKIGKPIPDLIERYRKRMYEEINTQGVPPIDGIHDLLDLLDKRGAHAPHRCIGTNAPMEKASLTLKGANLFDRFAHRDGTDRQTVFSAYEIEKWKPDPGLFLHAAQTMGYAPQDCVVIEDSPAGVRAGVSAGMRVIGFADITPKEVFIEAGATHVIHHYRELGLS